jgi:hypothetical protein
MNQESQFAIGEWIDTLTAAGVQISMDGKGQGVHVWMCRATT